MSTTRKLAAVLTMALTLGCGTQAEMTGPGTAASTSLVGGTVQGVSGALLTCTVLPYASSAQWIGPAGGSIAVGPHKLVIPRGALSQTVRITAEIPTDPVASVRFGPAGLRFAKPAAVTLSYGHCGGLGMLLPKQVAYTTDLLAILELLRSSDDLRAKKVTGKLDHFSRYAVAY